MELKHISLKEYRLTDTRISELEGRAPKCETHILEKGDECLGWFHEVIRETANWIQFCYRKRMMQPG